MIDNHVSPIENPIPLPTKELQQHTDQTPTLMPTPISNPLQPNPESVPQPSPQPTSRPSAEQPTAAMPHHTHCQPRKKYKDTTRAKCGYC